MTMAKGRIFLFMSHARVCRCLHVQASEGAGEWVFENVLDLHLGLLGIGHICGTFFVSFGQVRIEVSPYRVFGLQILVNLASQRFNPLVCLQKLYL